MVQLKVAKCPSDKLSLTNCLIVNDNDFDASKVKYVEVIAGGSRRFIFTIKVSNLVDAGSAGFSLVQRKWTEVSLSSFIEGTYLCSLIKDSSSF
ncbi:vesicle-fusing ATPase 1-like [Actinia tenebrosa]|uniref:Vesicle-fusing ATPase 1-like n=1 Tax=Actinia tenebrosa TaxID=6105 RepID=A0A6P8HLP6_ACTTE|nr:vesicle-fusing ATPase 1-like [Actinia tenebrosa]